MAKTRLDTVYQYTACRDLCEWQEITLASETIKDLTQHCVYSRGGHRAFTPAHNYYLEGTKSAQLWQQSFGTKWLWLFKVLRQHTRVCTYTQSNHTCTCMRHRFLTPLGVHAYMHACGSDVDSELSLHSAALFFPLRRQSRVCIQI